MNNNLHCRGFECDFYKPSTSVDGKKSFLDCKRPGKEQSLDVNGYEKCSECDVLNDCAVCFHKKTCKYVHEAAKTTKEHKP